MWDTIHAISTPEGNSPLGVIRITGPETIAFVKKIIPEMDLSLWPNFTKRAITFQLPGFSKIPGVLFCMRKPASYTCEDLVEFHLPGATPLLQTFSAHLVSSGIRLAHAGEFTSRAFMNGRISLAQAEGILELIHAENQAQLRAALHQLSGQFSQHIQQLRAQLTLLIAKIEANIDFSYHGDVEIDPHEIPRSLQEIQKTLQQIASQQSRRPQASSGTTVALIGPPNAGKSTLFNALIGQEMAITSEEAGTTRDVLEAEFSWKGCLFRVYDTAGFEEISEDFIKNQAQKFRRRLQEHCQICLFICPLERAEDLLLQEAFELISNEKLLVLSKCDLAKESYPHFDFKSYPVSAKTGEGLISLKDALFNCVHQQQSIGYGYLLNARQQAALQRAMICLEQAETLATSDLDFIAFELREASEHLATITGEIVSEDILAQIFQQFCIGK